MCVCVCVCVCRCVCVCVCVCVCMCVCVCVCMCSSERQKSLGGSNMKLHCVHCTAVDGFTAEEFIDTLIQTRNMKTIEMKLCSFNG